MNMELWNFLEKSADIKNKIVHIENLDFEYDDYDNNHVTYSVQINTEDADDESLIATYTASSNENENDLKNIVNHIVEKYFSDNEILDHENLLKN